MRQARVPLTCGLSERNFRQSVPIGTFGIVYGVPINAFRRGKPLIGSARPANQCPNQSLFETFVYLLFDVSISPDFNAFCATRSNICVATIKISGYSLHWFLLNDKKISRQTLPDDVLLPLKNFREQKISFLKRKSPLFDNNRGFQTFTLLVLCAEYHNRIAVLYCSIL